MAKSVKHANLDFPKARARLRPGRQGHWQSLAPAAHLGYQRQKGKGTGRWLLRRYTLGSGNVYRITPLGLADDEKEADGTTVLSHAQAQAKARAMIETPEGDRVHLMTVSQAMAAYIKSKEAEGKSCADIKSRGTAHIIPNLGHLVIADLTAERLRRWLSDMADMPAQNRPKKGTIQFRPEPAGDEAIRKRRATANRVLTMLKAVLNFAYDEKHVNNRDAWGRRLKPFGAVDVPRVRYLSITEAQRLINACSGDFRPLLIAALQTGCRYGEICRLQVADYNVDSHTLAIRRSKTGTARHVVLSDEAAAFFKSVCAGKTGDQLIFTRNGSPWKTAEQSRPMREACERAKIKPAVSIHTARHTWASHAIMNGTPLMVVAKNLGHVDTRMVERVYGHLAPSYVADAIRSGAPKFGVKPGTKVVRIK